MTKKDKKQQNEKKETKRSKIKYPTLVSKYNSRARQEYLDYDYVKSLSEENKKFLDDFNKEYYGANVGSQKDNGKDNRFFKDKESVKEMQDNNNARNRCLFGQVRNKVGATKLLDYHRVTNMVDDYLAKEINPQNLENAFIEYLDFKYFVDSVDETDDGSDGTDNSEE